MQVDWLVPGTKREDARVVFADLRSPAVGGESVRGRAVANENRRLFRAGVLPNDLHGPIQQRRSVGDIGRLMRETA